MAPVRDRLTFASSLALLLLLAVDAAAGLALGAQAIVLQLLLSYVSSGGPDRLRRPQLQSSSPGARVVLQDELLSNWYYTTRLWIEMPSQEFALIMDTGSTVKGIISHLIEHYVHLPENFGSYKLMEWNVEPPSRQYWILSSEAVMATISNVTDFGTSVAVIRSVFQVFCYGASEDRSSSRGTYVQSDAALPEQEHQPL